MPRLAQIKSCSNQVLLNQVLLNQVLLNQVLLNQVLLNQVLLRTNNEDLWRVVYPADGRSLVQRLAAPLRPRKEERIELAMELFLSVCAAL
jgi:hypothetical protein